MLKVLKSQFYELIKNLGYNISDNGEYVEKFPWLILRTNGYEVLDSFNAKTGKIILVLDIFSQYKGEKEIIEIVENIQNHLPQLQENNPEILYLFQKDLKILDDKKTGPVRRHGVVVYEFTMGYGVEGGALSDNTGAES